MNHPAKSPGHRRHHKRHDIEGHRSAGSGSGNSSSNPNKYVRECACGRGLACVGMTQAFRLLGDPRCYYVELPRFRKDPPAYKYTFRNNLRAAYLRHLKELNQNLNLGELDASSERRYVALHHFHPAVVKAFYENPLTAGAARKHKVPISITEHELQELNMDILEEDRILSVTGSPTGGYYFCPSYKQEKAHEDLKQLIKAERANREATTFSHSPSEPNPVPENIKLSKSTTPVLRNIPQTSTPVTPDSVEEPVEINDEENDLQDTGSEKNDHGKIISVATDDDSSTEVIPVPKDVDSGKHDDEGDADEEFDAVLSDNVDPEFDSIWAEEDPVERGDFELKAPNGQSNETDLDRISDKSRGFPVLESDGNGEIHRDPAETACAQEALSSSLSTALESAPKVVARENDHPWQTPKYRRHVEPPESSKRHETSPAHFIDPTQSSTCKEPMVDGHQIERGNLSDDDATQERSATIETKSTIHTNSVETGALIQLSGAVAAAQKSASSISAAALLAMKSIDEVEENRCDSLDKNNGTPGWSGDGNNREMPTPPRIQRVIQENKSLDDNRSQASDDSFNTGTIALKHNFPGADPTLRIQVHNDLIAWESKRRSDISDQLEYHLTHWHSLRSVLQDGLKEVEFAERFVAGFAKAGIVFADSTEAVYNDILFDDAGDTVNNSFLHNRFYKKRIAQEYSIESQDTDLEFGQSPLLTSILEAQTEIARKFRESSFHIEQDILPELKELRQELTAECKEFESLGDSILAELKRSEIELKNIWDVFDAMVTGDLMEYTVHGSMHGGSQHGSIHSSFGQSTGSLQGFLTPHGEGPIVSSVHSPMVKSTFRQLGAIEDGWLVEMYYRSAVAYQQAVFGIAENELNNLNNGIVNLEERRYRKLTQVMLAFVPRQRRLFNALPEQLKDVLDDLVGLRIDEETLQTLIDDSIKDRSHDHLKRGASHRSSIMNRSRINKAKEAEETEIERIEVSFGTPFKSSRVLLTKVVELQPSGFIGMVNTYWKLGLVVVTAEGNFLVFTLPEDRAVSSNNPFEAFKLLYPRMEFDSPSKWVRKMEISKNLTPTMSLSLADSTFVVIKMHDRQLQIVEDKTQDEFGNSGIGRNRFMKAMKAAADSQRSKKCTLRLSSASEVNDWINLLERTKKVLNSKHAIHKA